MKMLPCGFKKLTGHDCPGCGFQRSVASLAEGDLSTSFEFYPPLALIFILFFLLIIGCRLSVVGCGCWLSVVGCGLLAVSCWLFVVCGLQFVSGRFLLKSFFSKTAVWTTSLEKTLS